VRACGSHCHCCRCAVAVPVIVVSLVIVIVSMCHRHHPRHPQPFVTPAFRRPHRSSSSPFFISSSLVFVIPMTRRPCYLSFVNRRHSPSLVALLSLSWWLPLSSALPSPPTSSGLWAGWRRGVTWHPLTPCEQRLAVAALGRSCHWV
jgi:hypothetical protein